jgi:hypothetical protein
VHSIGGVMDFFDYAPAAAGSMYYNNLNTAGVNIDGVPDGIEPGMVQWEMINGDQGALVISHKVETDIPDFKYTSYYLDDKNPTTMQCTGDSYAYGSSGLWLNSPIENTDPSVEGEKHLELNRRIYYKAPGVTVDDAERLNTQANRPVGFNAKKFNLSYIPTSTPTPKMVISGYLRPDFTSDKMFDKSGFKVVVAGTNFKAEMIYKASLKLKASCKT